MIRQKRGTALSFLTIFLFLFVVPWIQPSEAQNSSIPRNKAVLEADGQGAKQKSSSLNLTEVQKKSLENLRHMYAKEAIPMKTSLMALKIELRHLLLDPSTQLQTLLEQQRKISALQAKFEELSLSYRVKARSILTREQLELLSQEWSFEMGLANETRGMGRFHRR